MIHFSTKPTLTLIVCCAFLVPQTHAQKPGSLSLPTLPAPTVAVSGNGKQVIAPLRSGFPSLRIHLKSGERALLAQRAYNPMFTPDSKRLLTSNGTILDVKTGKKILSLKGHQGRIVRARFSSDGKYVVTGSMDKTVRVWHASSGKELARLAGHDQWIFDVAMDPQNKWVISGSKDGTARIWDWTTGRSLFKLIGHNSNFWSVDFSKDSSRAVTVGQDGTARIWSTKTGEQIALLQAPNGINRAALNPNGNQIATYNTLRDNAVRVWSIENGKLLYSLKCSHAVQVVQFNANGSQLLTCGGEAALWDAKTGKQVLKFKKAMGIRYAQLLPNEQQMIGASRKAMGIWDAKTGAQLRAFDMSDRSLRSLSATPDGENAIVSGFQDQAAIWDLTTGKRSLVLQGGHAWQIWNVAFSPNGSRVATASLDQTARLWDANTGKEVAVLKGHDDRVRYASFSHSGKYLFTGSGPNNNTGRIWDAETGKLIQELQGHTDKVIHARFSRDEKQVLTGSDDYTARLWEVGSGKELHRFKHGSTITTAEFSPDEKSILTASSGWLSLYWMIGGKRANEGSGPSKEHSAKIWDTKTGKQRAHLEHPAGVMASFTPDGMHVVTACRGTITFWSADSGKKGESFRGRGAKGAKVIFCPNRQYFVVLEPGKPAELWSITDQKKLREIKVDKPFRSFFSRDSRTFYSMTRQGKLSWWPIGKEK